MAPIYIIILFLTPGDAMIDGDEDGADENRACQKPISVFFCVKDVTFYNSVLSDCVYPDLWS